MAMVTEKGALLSTGVWGGVISLLPFIDSILTHSGVLDPNMLTNTAGFVAAAIGGVLSIWGRVRASKKISGLI